MNIRLASKSEQTRLYEICVLTGESGKDATGVFQQPDLLGDIWVGPYLEISPEHCFVLEGVDGNPLGYCIGTLDSTAFEKTAAQTCYPWELDCDPPGLKVLPNRFIPGLRRRHEKRA